MQDTIPKPPHPFEAANPPKAAKIRDATSRLARSGDVTRIMLESMGYNDDKLGDSGLSFYAQELVRPLKYMLNLRSNELTDAAVPDLLSIIARSPELEAINLAKNHFTPRGIAALADGLRKHTHLKWLCLDENPLHGSGQVLKEMFSRQSPPLHEVFLRDAGLDDADLSTFAEGIAGNHKLGILDISGNSFQPAGISALIGAMAQGNSLLHQLTCLTEAPALLQAFERAIDRKPPLTLTKFTTGNRNNVFPITAKNYEELTRSAMAAKQFFQAEGKDLSGLDGYWLRNMHERRGGLFNPVLWRDTLSSHIETARQRFDAFYDQLPGLPGNPQDVEALFAPDTRGYAPLDNPRLWASREEAAQTLDSLPLSPELLRRQTPKGSGLAEAASAVMTARELTDYFNRKGLSIGPEQLLDQTKQAPSRFYQAMLERHQGYAFFTPANLLHHYPKEKTAIYHALPERDKQRARGYYLSIQSPSAPTGRGR